MKNEMIFPKPIRVKKRKRHKKSILPTEKNVCYLCMRLYGDGSRQYTEEHHILYGSGKRAISEAEGLKVDLCPRHHKEGPEAVHNNREMRRMLCRIAQEEFEKTHTREEWMELSGKNYLDS